MTTQLKETTMRVARVPRRGGPDFRIDEVPIPEPEPGQILIRVESAAVNFSDVKRRRGDVYPFETTFPFVPGGEVAGTVVALGAGVDSPAVGTRVFALAGPNGFGGYAQYAVSYATTAVPIPDGLSADAASVLIVAGCTAKIMLETGARLAAGETILVPAAAGGVGSFALQIARRLGARLVIGVASGPRKAAAAREFGAHEVVDGTAADWPARVRDLTGGKGVDVALEASGGAAFEATFSALAPFGRLVVFGAASGRPAALSAPTLDALFYAPAANQSVSGFNVGAWFLERPEVAGPALARLVQDVAGGRVRVPPIEALPLARAADAHRKLEGREVVGKLVLKPWE